MDLSGVYIFVYVLIRCKHVLIKQTKYLRKYSTPRPIYTTTGSILYLIQRCIKKSGRILTLSVNILNELQ